MAGSCPLLRGLLFADRETTTDLIGIALCRPPSERLAREAIRGDVSLIQKAITITSA
jgi:hypothetical protein